VVHLRAPPGLQGVHLFSVERPEAISRTVERAGVVPPA